LVALAGEADGDVTALLRPLPADRLRIWPVERTVNNVRNLIWTIRASPNTGAHESSR
jgi:putative SOS response-associated peptidase YedK